MRLLVYGFASVLLLSVLIHAKDEDDDFEEGEELEDSLEIEKETENEAEEPAPFMERPVYKTPVASGNVFFTETFDSREAFKARWIRSLAKKDGADDTLAKYDGEWIVEESKENSLIGDLGLVLKNAAKHHAISAKLEKPFMFDGKPLIIQYEVKFQNGHDCGGAYIKLLTQDGKLDLENFYDKTRYTIMFGPDKCGLDNRLHFIFQHKNPITGTYEEKHAKQPSQKFEHVFTDKKTHLYTLVIHPDNQFEIYIDEDLVNSGNLLKDFTPPVNPPKEIADPDDKKPDDWDDREKIPDPNAKKPDDWDEDEPEMIPDEKAEKPEGWLDNEPELIPSNEAEKPSDWDDDVDGEWEPPLINNPNCESAPGCGEWSPSEIKNPKYKGKWHAPLVDNPDYKGKWSAKMIPNPEFFEDNQPYKMSPISALGLELWSMSEEIFFDNFIISDDKSVADQWAYDTWRLKRVQELSGLGRSVVDAVLDATNERPWLWVVIVLTVILPIILIAYCCMSPTQHVAGSLHKKTDAPTEDDKDESDADDEGEEAEHQEDYDNADDTQPSNKELDGNKAAHKSSKPGKESSDKADCLEKNEQEDISESKEQANTGSPRKRKNRARKD